MKTLCYKSVVLHVVLAVPFLLICGGPLWGQAEQAEESGILLQFPNNPVTDILGVYEKLTGLTVVKDSEIFEGASISLVTPGEVNREEAIRLIESALQVNDFILSHDLDRKMVIVMPKDTNQASISESVKVYADEASIPDSESIIGYFMKLKHLSPAEAGSIFSNHAGLNPYGRITPVANPPGLLITESASMIRRLISLQDVVDVPFENADYVTDFVTLTYADASTVAQIVQATLTNRPERPRVERETFSSGRNRRSDVDDERVPPQVVADHRLNRVMVVAQADDFAYIVGLIEEWDKPVETNNTYERALKYLYVDEVLPVLVDILRDTGSGTTQLPGGGAISVRETPQASTQASALTGRLRQGVEVRDTTTGSIESDQDTLVNPIENTAPISVSINKTRIVADLQANKIIAMGPRENLNKIESLLDRLDLKPPQVYLSTVIGQLTLGDDLEFGVEYLQRLKDVDNPLLDAVAGSFITRDSLANAIGDSRDNILTSGVDAMAPGLSIYGQLGDSLDAFVTALESTKRFKVISRPAIYAANNKKAVITSGQRIPVPTSSVTGFDDNSTNVRTNIDFQDVVLKLEVIPLINSDKEVTLTIAQVNDTVVGEQRVSDNIVPIIGTEKLTTTVTIPNRSTVVLGGLITENEESSTEGVPVISRIPLLGHAFKSTRKRTQRTELIIFIQPVVVQTNAEIAHASLSEDMRTAVGVDAAETFPDLDMIEGSPRVFKAVQVEEEMSRGKESNETSRFRFESPREARRRDQAR